MYRLNEVPPPPDSHYVGIIFLFEENENTYFLTVKDKDKYEGHINTKLPGGSNERADQDYIPYENYLFKILERLKFERRAQVKILKNERNRKKMYEEEGADVTLSYILRTMVIQCLKKIGYYPLDFEPKVAHVVEKDGHTQYFLVIERLLNSKGDEILIPEEEGSFKALDLDIRATRVPIALSGFRALILSHRTAFEKFLILSGRSIPGNEEEE